MKTSQKIICFILLLQGVWCNFSVSLPEKIEALSGSCVIINCRFDINSTYDKDLTDTAGGVWCKGGHKTPENVVFNSRTSQSTFEGNITGTLKDKNCTTVFYNVNSNHKGRFFFRIEGNDKLIYSYTERSAEINVIETPPRPTMKMFKELMEVQEVLEGNAVRLSCSSITLCSFTPPTLTWNSTNRFPINENNRLQQQQNETEIISDLNFTATYLQHKVTFTCTITYQLQNRNTTAQSNITLRVLYAPKNTSVSVFPSNSVLEGSSVTLTCRSDANPAVLDYTWYRENGGQLKQILTGQNLSFSVADRTLTGRYYCQAKNQHGTQNTSVLLDIQYPPKNTSISVIPSSTVLEGNPVTLICRSDANPAVLDYTWYRENKEQLEQIQTGQNLIFSVANRTLTGRYYCQAINQHGTQNTSVLLDIQYAPKISLFSCNISHNSCECEAQGNPSPKVEWHLSGRPITNSSDGTYTFYISEEKLSSTHLKSFITAHPTLTDTLDCVAINKYGNTQDSPQMRRFNLFWVLIGVAVGVSVIVIMCAITCFCKRRGNRKPSQEQTTRSISTNAKNKEDILSSATDDTLNQPETLLYSSIVFKKNKTESEESRRVSSSETEYATVKYNSAGMAQCSTNVSADMATKQVKSKNSNEADTELYAQVKHRNP